MSLDTVRDYFRSVGFDDRRIIELDESSATVALAAQALGTQEERIAKSLSFMIESHAIIIVAAGDAKIQNGKYKRTFGKKAKMIPFDDVEKRIGHPAGGVCPFGVKEGVAVYLDESLKRFDTVFPACGATNTAIELTLAELEELARPVEWIDVTKIPE
ncbi:MAG: YbaK/EbsC family protein [Erysipelotrichaceae bacterium]|nr:YbaK/EbsC family protein [Erysipelotrichaceae bacterium]